MARLEKVLRQEIELEIEAGTSLNNISKSYSVAKSTLYHHYKKIKGKKIKNPVLNFKKESELGEFL